MCHYCHPESLFTLNDVASIPVARLTALESLCKAGLATNNGGYASGIVLLIVGGAGGMRSWAFSLALEWHPLLKITAIASAKELQDWC